MEGFGPGEIGIYSPYPWRRCETPPWPATAGLIARARSGLTAMDYHTAEAAVPIGLSISLRSLDSSVLQFHYEINSRPGPDGQKPERRID
jgi:hypothetical protein